MKPDLTSITVSNEDLSPRILKSSLFSQGANLPHGYRLKERFVFDYEFEFILFSEGSMVIDNENHSINKGDLIFRKPGQYTQGIMPYSCYFVCVDMLGRSGKQPLDYDIYTTQTFQPHFINPVLESIPTVFHPPHTEKYQILHDSILKEFISHSPGSDLILKSYILNLIYQLYQDTTNPFINRAVPASPHHNVLKKVLDYIDANLEKKILLNDLAMISNLSPNHFHKVFTETMGLTPNAFISKIRLDKAKELLIRTDLPVSEISINCGFENIPYFSYLFKKHVCVSPGEFRKQHSYI